MFLANFRLTLDWHPLIKILQAVSSAGRKGRSDHVEGLADCKALGEDGGPELAQVPIT